MIASGTSRRLLLCRTDRLGDVILALPCARLLRRLYPRSHLAFLVNPYTAPVAGMLEGLDEVIIAAPEESPRDLAARLREKTFDLAIALYPERRVAQALKTAGIPGRAGTAYRWHSRLFTYRHREHRKHNLKHEAEYNLSLVWAAAGGAGRWEVLLPPDSLFPLPLRLPRLAEETAQAVLISPADHRIVAVHPGGSGSAHRWPQGQFAELVHHLAGASGLAVAVTGGPGEEDLCRTVAEESGVLNLCGQFDLPGLAAFYRRCVLAIANSTGPLHLARAVGTPALGLFPAVHAMSPRRWGPYGQPDGFLTAPAEGMDHLDVETVLSRARKLLEISP